MGNNAMRKRDLFETIGKAFGAKDDESKGEEGKGVEKRADGGDAAPKVEDMNIKWKSVGKGVVGVIKDGQALPLGGQ